MAKMQQIHNKNATELTEIVTHLFILQPNTWKMANFRFWFNYGLINNWKLMYLTIYFSMHFAKLFLSVCYMSFLPDLNSSMTV